jgi:hypothetical protein
MKTYTPHIWETDKLISKDLCFECGSDQTIHFHHVVPKSRGGKMAIPLCENCHGLVHGKNFLHHRKLQMDGIERAKLRGTYKGRSSDTIETVEKFLSKPKNKIASEYLKQGIKGCEISKITGLNPNTVSKIKKILKQEGQL